MCSWTKVLNQTQQQTSTEFGERHLVAAVTFDAQERQGRVASSQHPAAINERDEKLRQPIKGKLEEKSSVNTRQRLRHESA